MPEGARIHPVFHVSLLKKFIGEHTDVNPELPPVTDEGALVLEPEKVIDTRWVKQRKKFIEESLVQGRRLPAEEATWEYSEFLKKQFPFVDLEDKDPLDGGGVDRPPRRTTRRGKKNPKYFGEVGDVERDIACK